MKTTMIQKISIMLTTILFTILLTACGGAPFAAADPADAGDGGDPPGEGGLLPHADSGMVALVDSGTPDTSPGVMDSGSAVDTSPPAPMCTMPTTPMLDQVQGASYSGIQFHVTKDTILTSFTITTSEEQPDTVTLSDSMCNAIASASVPNQPLPGYKPYVVNVSWPLMAGKSYILTNGGNQTAHSASSDNITFPYASGILVVELGLTTCPDQGAEGQVWTAFTDLTFCAGDGGT